jgi:hypothetical protein
MQHFWIRAEAAIVCVIRVVGLLRPSVQLSGGQLAIPLLKRFIEVMKQSLGC